MDTSEQQAAWKAICNDFREYIRQYATADVGLETCVQKVGMEAVFTFRCCSAHQQVFDTYQALQFKAAALTETLLLQTVYFSSVEEAAHAASSDVVPIVLSSTWWEEVADYLGEQVPDVITAYFNEQTMVSG